VKRGGGGGGGGNTEGLRKMGFGAIPNFLVIFDNQEAHFILRWSHICNRRGIPVNGLLYYADTQIIVITAVLC